MIDVLLYEFYRLNERDNKEIRLHKMITLNPLNVLKDH